MDVESSMEDPLKLKIWPPYGPSIPFLDVSKGDDISVLKRHLHFHVLGSIIRRGIYPGVYQGTNGYRKHYYFSLTKKEVLSFATCLTCRVLS